MSERYATEQSFGGQRASVCRQVCVKWDGWVSAGIVVAINGNRPIIRAMAATTSGPDTAFNLSREELPFAEVRAEADIATAPARCWFWPPRV
jgi:hypothetical protein